MITAGARPWQSGRVRSFCDGSVIGPQAAAPGHDRCGSPDPLPKVAVAPPRADGDRVGEGEYLATRLPG